MKLVNNIKSLSAGEFSPLQHANLKSKYFETILRPRSRPTLLSEEKKRNRCLQPKHEVNRLNSFRVRSIWRFVPGSQVLLCICCMDLCSESFGFCGPFDLVCAAELFYGYP